MTTDPTVPVPAAASEGRNWENALDKVAAASEGATCGCLEKPCGGYDLCACVCHLVIPPPDPPAASEGSDDREALAKWFHDTTLACAHRGDIYECVLRARDLLASDWFRDLLAARPVTAGLTEADDLAQLAYESNEREKALEARAIGLTEAIEAALTRRDNGGSSWQFKADVRAALATAVPEPEGDVDVRALHAEWHDMPGNLYGRDECGYEVCEFWAVASWLRERLAAVPTPGQESVEWGVLAEVERRIEERKTWPTTRAGGGVPGLAIALKILRETRDQGGLRKLTCWSANPSNHPEHTHTIKDETYWCPGYPSDPRHVGAEVAPGGETDG